MFPEKLGFELLVFYCVSLRKSIGVTFGIDCHHYQTTLFRRTAHHCVLSTCINGVRQMRHYLISTHHIHAIPFCKFKIKSKAKNEDKLLKN